MPPPIAPELQFVLASLRRGDGAAAARADAAVRVTDWRRVATLATRHDVPWWVWRALPPDGVPPDVRRDLQEEVRALAVSALAGTGELMALGRVLDDAGVAWAAYKGPTMAADVHGDLGARRFTDLDLLIAERDRDRARRALMEAGYAWPGGYSAREERFYSAWEGVSHFERDDARWPVEVHWRVQAPRYGRPQDPAPIVARARRCAVGGGTVPLPDVEAQAALLALHGVKHAWTSMLWVADFAASTARTDFSWERLEALAAAWGVQRALHDALLVAQALVAPGIPAPVLARAQGDAPAARLAEEAVAGLLAETDTPNAGRESTARYDLRWLGSAMARLRYLTLAAAMPTPRERESARLPDALLPLAYPVRAWRLVRHAMGRRA